MKFHFIYNEKVGKFRSRCFLAFVGKKIDKIFNDEWTSVPFAAIQVSNFVTNRSVRLIVFESEHGIAQSDLSGRSLIGFGKTDGQFFIQILFLTIFF